MSILRCEQCERFIDTDKEEFEEVSDAVLCITCYQDFCEAYGEQQKQWWAQIDQDQQYQNEVG